jgi:hypothetical protein
MRDYATHMRLKAGTKHWHTQVGHQAVQRLPTHFAVDRNARHSWARTTACPIMSALPLSLTIIFSGAVGSLSFASLRVLENLSEE